MHRKIRRLRHIMLLANFSPGRFYRFASISKNFSGSSRAALVEANNTPSGLSSGSAAPASRP